jgi:glucokinase
MIRRAVVDTISSWKGAFPLGYCLGVDVGGSGIRLRFSKFSDPFTTIDHPHIPAKSAPELIKVLSSIPSVLSVPCRGSAIAIAGLRQGDTVTVMNWPASGRVVRFGDIPPALRPPKSSLFLNDLEACAYGILSAHESGTGLDYFDQIGGPPTSKLISPNANTAVLAMGSGLGAAVIVRDFNRNRVVVPTEMGWCLAGGIGPDHPDSRSESLLFTWASKAYGGKFGPIYEDMASGHGLVSVYNFLNNREVGRDAGEIAEKAKKGEKTALQAMKLHYEYFTKCARAVAVALKCDSVAMALANQVSNKWLVQQIKEDLDKVLNNDLNVKVGLFSQIQDYNFNLAGATYMAHRVARSPMP